MARTNIEATVLNHAGVSPAGTVGTADGHMFANSETEFLVLTNTGAAPRTVTIPTPATRSGQPVGDLAITVPAGATRYAGPFESADFSVQGGADRGKVYIDYPAGFVAEITTRVLRMPQL